MKMMGRSCHGDERWETEIEEEEEEALSFCDLPVKEEQQAMRSSSAAVETEEFDFKQWRPAPPMLAADELFFQGQMLPLRLSFSSENRQSNMNQLFGGNLWNRSESMDHNMLRFRNESTSSSSSRSHYSRSSSHSNNSISIPTNSKPRTQKNLFHSHPSPTPQIRSFSTSSHRSRSSSRWEFFRLGLLRTPGMELQDLKTRTTTTATATAAHKTTASILGVVSCKKSVDAVSATAVKNRRNEKVLNNNNNKKNNNSVEIREKEKEKERRVSHRRTFEWLKQLSHATFGEEQ